MNATTPSQRALQMTCHNANTPTTAQIPSPHADGIDCLKACPSTIISPLRQISLRRPRMAACGGSSCCAIGAWASLISPRKTGVCSQVGVRLGKVADAIVTCK